MNSRSKVFPGQRYGMLSVRECIGRLKKERLFRCVCDCGRETELPAYTIHTGQTKSCGCLRRKHGLYLSRTYSSWRSMLKRCYNPKHKSYSHYGAKGITVSSDWRSSFQSFLADMGEAPSSKHTIDRLNNELGYFKDNCRWATPIDQATNRKTSKYLEYQGVVLTYAQWCRKLGFPKHTISSRLDNGWSVEDALTRPICRGKPGSESPSAKLTEDIVREARRLRPGRTYLSIAKQFNVTKSAMMCAIKGKTWRHVS